ncbi:Serine/threonine-protein kinase 16; AltName: Full=Myristoylated and palmitoylated serine/threonine-protein kinase; Short=MPSK; AltName: Full=Protein kinase PKL12; AltName: Full=TGF-beta-stimulated factor 1; Short=TSF-1; AltName: Full=Tyrosine-protein kinase STK16; AltName: Full=hPSK [Serendipita indica DSM 11827]|nr:Serine/threonine-protein kinase 16; AltName: Full=Myristoylated and palmitoylated serine/threonine-protein kinase; Short=MPSK; AltName: Full=Protein kinase PKL12; AltName: Full=TGF-beta-stimulated factor 1; Short=TSF-1; AltName: Full=Tyrosine-protein kinase STK16; AltName: Full=hPSK [Serendipita indica DSM 11827]
MSYQDSLLRRFDALKAQAQDAIWALTSCVCKPSATVKVNGRTYKIVKALGEGGFSFVYLAQDESTGREFALKKIRVHNSEGVKGAMREIEAYRRFRHPNIIRIYDSSVVQDPSGEGKIVYLFLPLYKRGNLQDAINANTVNNTRFSEKEMLVLFKGTCEAVRAMHDYHVLVPINTPDSNAPVTRAHHSAQSSTSTIRPETFRPQPSKLKDGYTNPSNIAEDDDEDEEPEDDHSFPEPEGDTDGGYSYGGSVPLVPPKNKKGTSAKGKGKPGVVFDGDEELERLNAQQPSHDAGYDSGSANGEVPPGMKRMHVPYAHRDIKPGNVMLSDEGNPILMDFGSTVVARMYIATRSEALTQQDIAAEQSTMTFRAPELFDVKTGVTLDEKVDIWSLGCTLYALAYNRSPFETAEQAGGSIAMAAMNGQYKHPAAAAGAYSQGLRDLIDACMVVDPASRPDIHRILEITDGVLRTLG